jgi:hypothetical protein
LLNTELVGGKNKPIVNFAETKAMRLRQTFGIQEQFQANVIWFHSCATTDFKTVYAFLNGTFHKLIVIIQPP